jgi:BirA family biotin operon repressor/biotin-[acetyl-CoA-carboxylase] ligase
MSPAERLDAKALRAAFDNGEVVVLDETTSTNDVAFELATKGRGTAAVFAERQTAGRGQHGKRWESAAGRGLWFSLLLQGETTPNESRRVTTWAAETVAATLNEQFSLGATIKPPNDVYVESRKVAGVLLELRALPRRGHAAILGIGINVNHAADDFPPALRGCAASVAMLSGKQVDRQALAIALLRRLRRAHPHQPLAVDVR